MEKICENFISLRIDENQSEKDFLLVFLKNEISSKNELFEFFKKSLKIPEYFGNNWDAFEECLLDLSWISQKFVFIIHFEFPKIGDDELVIYKNILISAVNYHKKQGDHDLIIFYPRNE